MADAPDPVAAWRAVLLAQSRAVVTAFPLDWVVANATFAEAFASRHWETLKRFGLWEELLAEPAPDARLPLATASWHALRGTAFAATGRGGEAFLAGEIAFGQGRVDAAIERLQEAVRLEDALKYDEPPACVVPARHALGAVLLSAGQAKEAEAVYRADLRAYPANYWSLLGLQKALAAQGRKPEAAAAEEAFRRAQARAQVKAETSCLCVKGKG